MAEEVKPPYFNDNWTHEIDGLGYETFAHNVRQMILETSPPFSLTIGGRWGSGKTSMLKTLMGALEPGRKDKEAGKFPSNIDNVIENPPVRTVWFNPWQYQGEANPMVPLLHEIREQITGKFVKNLSASAVSTYQDGIGLFVRLADFATSLSLGVRTTGLGAAAATAIEKARDRHARETFSGPVDAQRFHQQFEKAIQYVLNPSQYKNSSPRLVIFIDDLDRCDGKTVYALLEAIKLYLSTKSCVFVFALDRIHVEAAVVRVGGYTPSEAADYVEKLFQARLHLPRPTTEQLKGFMDKLLRESGYDGFYTSGDIFPLLPANPRSIKNFLNGLTALRPFIQEHLSGTDEKQRVLLVHWLRVFAPDIYELLATGGPKVQGDFLDYCKNPQPVGELRQFFHRNLETPLLDEMRTPAPDDGKEKILVASEEKRYHQMRSRVWREKATQEFRQAFASAFPDGHTIKDYLI